MKAAVLDSLEDPLVILDDIEIPELRKGQVLVKLAFSGVCHSQLMEAQGKRGVDKYLPHLLGHEGSGTVIEVGEDVSKVSRDDEVILTWIKSSGIDAGGTQYSCNGRVINAGSVTTFNDYAVVSENRCVKLPHGVPMNVAPLFGCALLTGGGIILNTIQPPKGSNIAIFGLGGVGMSALIATNIYECNHVIAIDVEDEKLELAKLFGASITINSSKQDVSKEIMDITNHAGVDFSVESAGLCCTIEIAFSVVRNSGGLCVFASHPAHGERIRLDPYDLISGKQIKGSWGGGSDPDKDIPLYADLYRKGRLPLQKLISQNYQLGEINEALQDIENHKVGRPVIEF